MNVMKHAVYCLKLPLFMGSFLFASCAYATSVEQWLQQSDPALKKAVAECANQTVRLNRLACFDALFPSSKTASEKKVYEVKPETWQRAWDAEAQRKDQQGFLVNRVNPDDDDEGVWLTLAANGGRDASVVLMMSCIDNITRLDLVLLEPLNHAVAQISLSHHQDTLTSRWLSDESGMIFRTSRGLGAIDTVKFLMQSSRVSLRSDVPEINGLTFDTQGLRKHVQILRSACHW